MVLITLKPQLARLLISPREYERERETFEYLEEEIREGRWNNTKPIWITPNLLLNGFARGFVNSGLLRPTLRPFIIYNGHHRFEKAIEHQLPIRAYVRYTPFNPNMPKEERLQIDVD